MVFHLYSRRRIAISSGQYEKFEEMSTPLGFLLKILETLKLIRLVRVREIMTSSDVIRDLQQKNRSSILRMIQYVFLIIIVSHWFACIWCFTAYAQVRSFGEDALLETPNWIAYWYSNNYSESGVNPLGWENDLNR